MNRLEFNKKKDMYLHGGALYVADRDKIPYRDALLKVAKFFDEHETEVIGFMEQSYTPEGVKAARQKVQSRLNRIGEEAEAQAIASGINFGTALIALAKQIATETVDTITV